MTQTQVNMWRWTSLALALGITGIVCGQEYPSKPIRIVTSGVGGGNDFIARLIAQGISGPLGQQVVVENRPSGLMPGAVVSKAPPDGYTLLLAGNSFMMAPLLQKAPYDTTRDFSPITIVNKEPSVIVMHPSVPVRSVKELIALAKAKPGALHYASTAIGSSTHLSPELFKSMAGVNIVQVPYKTPAQAISDLIGGHVQIMFSPASSVTPHVKSGKLKALAVTSAEPSALAPGLPPVAAAVPGYEDVGITGVWVPIKTPEPIINRLNQEIVRFIKTPEAKGKFFDAGSEVVGSSPQELAAMMKASIESMGKVIKDAGIRAE